MGHEDPLELSTFFLFSRGDVSICIVSKGEMTMWGWWGSIKTRLGTETLGIILGVWRVIQFRLIQLCRFLFYLVIYFIFWVTAGEGWLDWDCL